MFSYPMFTQNLNSKFSMLKKVLQETIWRDEHPQPAMDFFDNAQLREKTRRAIDMTKFRLDSPGKL